MESAAILTDLAEFERPAETTDTRRFATVPGQAAGGSGEYGVRSVSRALSLLRAMATARRSEWSLDELSRATGLPKTTTHRLLNAMAASGFVEHARCPGFYRLGLESAIVGNACLQHRKPEDGVARVLEDLSARVGETVGIGLLSGSDALALARTRPPGSPEPELTRGAILPAHASCGGKVLLASLPTGAVEEIYRDRQHLARYTPNTITSLPTLLQHLADVRKQGYAIDDEEYVIGVRCVGVAVPGLGHAPRYTVGLAAPAARADLQRLRIAVAILEVAALKLAPLLQRPR